MTSPSDSKSHIRQRKILVLHGHKTHQPSLLEPLRQHFEIVTVPNIEQALQRLQHEEFDAVFSETADFLPLERASVSQQATAILNTIGEGVCIVAADGTILWANQLMQAFDEPVKQSVSHHSQQAYNSFGRHLESEDVTDAKTLRSHK